MKKILIIEDDVLMLELLVHDFTEAGFSMTGVRTGKEGLARFSEEKPDLVLLDILLPDENGFDTLRKIRHTAEGKEAKVAIISNVAESKDREEAKELGAVDYFVKTEYTIPEILEKVKKLI